MLHSIPYYSIIFLSRRLCPLRMEPHFPQTVLALWDRKGTWPAGNVRATSGPRLGRGLAPREPKTYAKKHVETPLEYNGKLNVFDDPNISTMIWDSRISKLLTFPMYHQGFCIFTVRKH